MDFPIILQENREFSGDFTKFNSKFSKDFPRFTENLQEILGNLQGFPCILSKISKNLGESLGIYILISVTFPNINCFTGKSRWISLIYP